MDRGSDREKLLRLLVLNDYGFSIENLGPGRADEPDFLSDGWLARWFGDGWCPSYVQDELDAVPR